MWFADEFKQDAAAQVVAQGYAVSEMAEPLGINERLIEAGIGAVF